MPQVPAPYTALPSAVLVHQVELGLSPQQVCLIAQLCSFQWDHRLPYPSVQTLARRMGLSRSQVLTYLRQLQARGYLQVHPRRRPDGGATSNAYDLAPLWQRAQALATAAPARGCPPDAPAGVPEGPPTAGHTPPVQPAAQETPESNQPDWKHQAAPFPAAGQPAQRPDPVGGGVPLQPVSPDPSPHGAAPPLVQALVERGMTVRTAQLLVRTYPPERIRAQLAHLDALPVPPRNPAGWLACAIRHNYRGGQAGAAGPAARPAAPHPGPAPAAAPHPPRAEQPPVPRPAAQRAAQEVAALEAIRQQLGLGPFSAAERARREALARGYYASLAGPPAGEQDRTGAGAAAAAAPPPVPLPRPAGAAPGRGGPLPLGALLGSVLPGRPAAGAGLEGRRAAPAGP